MRSYEDRETALECLKLAVANIGSTALADRTALGGPNVITDAERFYAFVTGELPEVNLEARVAGIERWAWGGGPRS